MAPVIRFAHSRVTLFLFVTLRIISRILIDRGRCHRFTEQILAAVLHFGLQKQVQRFHNKVLRMARHGLLAQAGLLHHLMVQVRGEHFHQVVISLAGISQNFIEFGHGVKIKNSPSAQAHYFIQKDPGLTPEVFVISLLFQITEQNCFRTWYRHCQVLRSAFRYGGSFRGRPQWSCRPQGNWNPYR